MSFWAILVVLAVVGFLALEIFMFVREIKRDKKLAKEKKDKKNIPVINVDEKNQKSK